MSEFYERNKAYFPNFQTDLTAHLKQYLEGDELTALGSATTLVADIEDWTVTDLGGTRREVGGSLASSNAAMLGSVQGGSSSNFGLGASSGAGGSGAINSGLVKQAREKSKETGEDDEEPADDSEDSQ